MTAGAVRPLDGASSEGGGLPRRLYLVLGSLIALAPLSTDLYLPGLPDLAMSLGSSEAQAQLTVSASIIGMSVGQLVLGSLSDRVGRRPVVLASLVAFVVASLLCAAAPTMTVLLVLRLVQGFAGAAGPVVARAAVRDLVSGVAAARALSRLVLVMGLAPVLGPFVGGQVLRVTDWRGLFVVLAVLGAAILLLSWWLLPETHAEHHRLVGHPREQLAEARNLLRDRAFAGYLAIGALLGVVLFSWISTSSFLLVSQYGVSPQGYSLVFACTAAAFVTGAQLNAVTVGRIGPRPALTRGLVVVAGGAVLLLLAVVAHAPLAVVVGCAVVTLAAYGGMAANSQALALGPHGRVAGTASALLGFSQFVAGAFVPPTATALLGATWSMPASMLAAAVGALVLLRLVVPRPARS